MGIKAGTRTLLVDAPERAVDAIQLPDVDERSAGRGKAMGTDLTLREVIRIGYDHGLVESTTLKIDDNWSAIKFTHHKRGKEYRNSYGKLPENPGRKCQSVASSAKLF
jgi:hypothetical protein